MRERGEDGGCSACLISPQDLQTIGRGERSDTPVSGGQHDATPQGLDMLDSFSAGVFNPCLYSVSLAGTFVTYSISPVAACVVAFSASPLERGVTK